VLLLRGLSKGDGKLVDEDGLQLPPRRGVMSSTKVQGCSPNIICCAALCLCADMSCMRRVPLLCGVAGQGQVG